MVFFQDFFGSVQGQILLTVGAPRHAGQPVQVVPGHTVQMKRGKRFHFYFLFRCRQLDILDTVFIFFIQKTCATLRVIGASNSERPERSRRLVLGDLLEL